MIHSPPRLFPINIALSSPLLFAPQHHSHQFLQTRITLFPWIYVQLDLRAIQQITSYSPGFRFKPCRRPSITNSGSQLKGSKLGVGNRKSTYLQVDRMKRKSCELCNAVSSVYCAADSAFLCSSCDASVHGANFLVARHVRWTRCVPCGSLLLISGPESDPLRRLCGACRSCPAQPCSSSHSDASSCLSTAESKKRRRQETPPRGSRVKTKRGRNAREAEVEAVSRIARARKLVAREEEGWAESD